MEKNKRSRTRFIILAMLGLGLLGMAVGAANAAMQSIQLNSAATFPVDI